MNLFHGSKNLQKLEMVPYPSEHKLGKDETHKLEDNEWVLRKLFCPLGWRLAVGVIKKKP